MNSGIRDNLDWSKYKTAVPVKRGDISMIASTVIRGGEIVAAPSRERFVWPRGLEDSGAKILTRRVWAQSK